MNPQVELPMHASRRGVWTATSLRADFPALAQTVHDRPLVYLDSAASAQTPQSVLQEIFGFYERDRSNIHRGAHTLSQRATDAYEEARGRVAAFIGAPPSNLVFTRGTTEGVNLVAQSWAMHHLTEGDLIVVSAYEHHSNLVPWHRVSEQTGARVEVIPLLSDGTLDQSAYETLLSKSPKLVALAHISNVLGTVTPVKHMIELAHACQARVMIDGAQAVPHIPVHVPNLGADFYAFSGHKMYGPTGIGGLYIAPDLIDEIPPFQGGGGMIESVSFAGSTFLSGPQRFEAGTPHIAGAIGLGAATDYLRELRMERVADHSHQLVRYAHEQLSKIEGLRMFPAGRDPVAACSFVLEDIHPNDVGTLLDSQGIAVRTGHHCAQPLMGVLGVTATVRASFGVYNDVDDVDALVAGLQRVQSMFGAS